MTLAEARRRGIPACTVSQGYRFILNSEGQVAIELEPDKWTVLDPTLHELRLPISHSIILACRDDPLAKDCPPGPHFDTIIIKIPQWGWDPVIFSKE